jgi:hypothetical protein
MKNEITVALPLMPRPSTDERIGHHGIPELNHAIKGGASTWPVTVDQRASCNRQGAA